MIVENNSSHPSTHINLFFGDAPTITKRTDASWVAGSGVGGVDGTPLLAGDTCHIFRIDGPSGVDAILSASSGNPSLPSGFTTAQRIASIPILATGLAQFKQTGRYFGLCYPASQFTGVNSGAVLRELSSFPKGEKFRAKIAFAQHSPTGASYFAIKDPDEGVSTVADFCSLAYQAGKPESAVVDVYSSNQGCVFFYGHRSDTTVTTCYLKGWSDDIL